MVRAAADKPGVLYAFIVLDNPANSILDMQVRRWAAAMRRLPAHAPHAVHLAQSVLQP